MRHVVKPAGNPTVKRGMKASGRPSVVTGKKPSKRHNGTKAKGGCRKCKGG